MRLSQTDWDILYSANFLGELPIRDISRQTRRREHVVRHAIEKFTDAGLFNKRLLINIDALGFTEYCITFGALYEKPSLKDKLRQFLIQCPSTGYVIDFAGDFEFTCSVLARNIHEFADFLDTFGSLPGVSITDRRISIRKQYKLYRRKYFSKLSAKPDEITLGGPSASAELDETDIKILIEMNRMTYSSYRDLAQKLRLPHATVNSRINRLYKKKIILSVINGIWINKLGLTTYRLYIATNAVRGSEDRFFKFAKAHPQIIAATSLIGQWDFELLVEVHDADELMAVIQQTREFLGPTLVELKTLMVLRYHKLATFPFGFEQLRGSDGLRPS